MTCYGMTAGRNSDGHTYYMEVRLSDPHKKGAVT